MEDVLEEIGQKPNILELLRLKQIEVDPTTDDEKREKIKLVIEHESKFPSKLREIIRSGAEENESEAQPDIFLWNVYKAITAFFFGQPYPVDGEDENEGDNDDEDNGEQETGIPSNRWHGLDSDVDTEDEAELAIRFFPCILNEEYNSQSSSMRGAQPIYILMTCSKAISFVPLLAELGTELGRFTEKQRGGLGCTFRGVFFQLVHDTIRKDKFDDEESGKHDEVCTVIMMRLKEKGLMRKEDIHNHNLMNLLLYRAIYSDKLVIEKRVRFIVGWDPYILMECAHPTHLLHHLVKHLASNNDGQIPPGTLRRFQLIFELGLLYFPSEVGFLFHRNTFQLACKKFGGKHVTDVIDCELSNSLRRKKDGLADMVFSAAANNEISLDGLYILFRRDPIEIMSNLSKDK